MKDFLIKVILSLFLVMSAPIASAGGDLIMGKKVFENSCASCHTGGFKGLISGAPDVSKKDLWTERLSKPVTQLYAEIINGTDKHEPKGDCEDCSEDDIKNAIDYIISVTK